MSEQTQFEGEASASELQKSPGGLSYHDEALLRTFVNIVVYSHGHDEEKDKSEHCTDCLRVIEAFEAVWTGSLWTSPEAEARRQVIQDLFAALNPTDTQSRGKA